MNKGLFIGVNEYSSERVPSLQGCKKDAEDFAVTLDRHDDSEQTRNFQSKVLVTKETTTKKVIRQEFMELWNGNNDIALFYFSGHGSYQDSIENLILIPSDFEEDDDGIRMQDILIAADKSEAKNKIIILDCCHSGAVAQSANAKISKISDGMTIIAACSKKEYAIENGINGGLFTSLLIQALDGGAANILGDITPSSLYSFVDGAFGAWNQRPIFKSNVQKFITLKKTPPKVPRKVLLKLPELFENPQYTFRLDKTYEPDEDEYYIPEHGEIFKMLQNCNRFGLVEPVDTCHMYYAAINGTGCRLTKLGMYYYKLAMEGVI